MSENTKKESLLKYAMAFTAITLSLIVLSVLTFVHIDRILLETSMETMTDMADHDRRVLLNEINAEWESLEKISVAFDKMKIEDEKDVINCLQVVNLPYSNDLTMLITEDGLCFQSDGLISSTQDYLNAVNGYGDRFAVTYDMKKDGVMERRKEYMLIGIRTNCMKFSGRTFRYALKRINISALDSELKLRSYGGEGSCSVIDSNGDYIVSMNRNGSVMERRNFYSRMSSVNINGGRTIDELMGELRDSTDGVSFSAALDGKKYIMCICRLDPLDWYFVYRVPSSVFSSLSREVFSVVTGLLLIIIAGTLLIIWLRTRGAINRAAEIEEHRCQLSAALELAQQSSSAKTRFLNSMSHDIRTPINAIVGFTYLADRHIGNSDMVKDYLNRISQSSKHLLSIVNDVLDMSRIDSGNLTLKDGNEDMGEMLHSVINMVMPQVNEKGLRLYIDTQNIRDEHVVCDRLHLTQILLNLASNAVKFTPDGGHIFFRITQGESIGNVSKYEFSIRDNGIGISEDFLGTMFEPFTREQSSTVSGIPGTGLGLSIIRGLVEMMNGTISCNTAKGHGTEFVVSLPIKIREEVCGEAPELNVGVKRALLFDENGDSCRSIARMLEKHGIECDCCTCGDEAVKFTGEALFAGEPYDYYLVGCHRGGRDIRTAQQIRREAGKNACIVVVSVYDPEIISGGVDMSFVTCFLSKPVFPSDIRRLLLKLSGNMPAPESKPDLKLGGHRVLLAEDNEVNMHICRSILTLEGMEVETAANGREACELLARSGSGYFDVILMDVQMPEMDGYEATRRIRGFRDRSLATVPIIAMTANAFAEDRHSAFAAGMDSYISKPFDVSELLQVISGQIKEGSAQ